MELKVDEGQLFDSSWCTYGIDFLIDMDASGKILLDFDVLNAVMGLLTEREDVSRMMRTCSSLYWVGVPILLSFGVDIKKERHLSSFVEFMAVDIEVRCNHLRQISI